MERWLRGLKHSPAKREKVTLPCVRIAPFPPQMMRGDAAVAEKAHNLLVMGSIPIPAKENYYGRPKVFKYM
jgi:hypothetical protein